MGESKREHSVGKAPIVAIIIIASIIVVFFFGILPQVKSKSVYAAMEKILLAHAKEITPDECELIIEFKDSISKEDEKVVEKIIFDHYSIKDIPSLLSIYRKGGTEALIEKAKNDFSRDEIQTIVNIYYKYCN